MSNRRTRAGRAGLIERWLVGAALALAALVGQIGGPIAHGLSLDSAVICAAPACPPEGAPAPGADHDAPADRERDHHDPSHCAVCQAFASVRAWACTGAAARVATAVLEWSAAHTAVDGQARVASLWRAHSRGPPACAIVA